MTASERIREARRAWQIATYEREGWPLELVQQLNACPDLSLHNALDWYSEGARRAA